MEKKIQKSKKKSKKKSESIKASSKEFRIKREIFGLLLIAIGVLVGITILSYNQNDPIGSLEQGNIYKVKNWLGIAGATISAPIFQWTIGYPVIIIPLLISLSGFCLLLHIPLKKVSKLIFLGIFWSLFVGVLLALPQAVQTFGDIESYYPSGLLGGVLASLLVRFLSKFGAVFILVVIFFILFIFTFNLRISFFAFQVGKLMKFAVMQIKSGFHWLKSKLIKPVKPAPIKQKLVIKHGESSASIDAELEDPFYQPSLPTRKVDAGITSDSPIEIVHHKKTYPRTEVESSGEKSVQDEDWLSQKVPQEIEGDLISEPFSDKSSELGFEVQEPFQEKELDYDTLVRDSLAKYQFPSSDILYEDVNDIPHLSEFELKNNARLLEDTLAQFGVKANVNRVVEGPVITLYEVKPAQGVKISKIVSLSVDLALAMRAKGIRMIAPIPGKAAIGIEIPNRKPSTVYFKSIVRSETYINFSGNLVLGLGKTISGEVYCSDLTKMPHLLMAGATGSGKSVGINTMIASLMYRVPPSDLKFVMIDPKKLELSIFARLKDHYLAIAPDLDEVVITHPQNAIMILRAVVYEMEERYDKLASLGVREITHYNRKIEEYKKNGESSDEFRKLPYIVVVIDELADLILSATREIEEPITRLAQMARAVGIHLIMATQRPSVDILTGLIKANFPARIAYQVATRPDSKVILDMYGAEQLIGNGDMLFFPPGKVKPIRLQNPLITTEEVERIIKDVRKQPKFPPYELKLVRVRTTKGPGSVNAFDMDELFEEAKKIVIHYNQGSVSLLQRKLKIGYARAARIMDQLEDAGIVGPQVQDGKAREVRLSDQRSDLDY